MTLIKSISGIRGTIGGEIGNSLSPNDLVAFTAAFGYWLKKADSSMRSIVIGRDARVSGEIITKLVSATLQSQGLNVVDLGLSTTPTVEMAVVAENAIGGIILTASHNPKEWNALKLLNAKGEFISAEDISQVLDICEKSSFQFEEIDNLGTYCEKNHYLNYHIDAITALDLVDIKSIQEKNFKVVIDGINSTGGLAVSTLLERLGVHQIVVINSKPTGLFAHNPEPLTENLGQLTETVKKGSFDLGIAVDPDVDRLVLICEDGTPFNEEYTLVAVADYVLSHQKGNTVSNLSSTTALKDISKKHGVEYYPSAVGEVNVVEKMKEVNAIIGGEGNGGIIYPALHYGRDALVGIALILSSLSKNDFKISTLKNKFPLYFMYKTKVPINPEVTFENLIEKIKNIYTNNQIITIDGIKVEFEEGSWVHIRKSNTEPILRIYSEAKTSQKAEQLVTEIKENINL